MFCFILFSTGINASNYSALNQYSSLESKQTTLPHDPQDAPAKSYRKKSINDDIITVEHHDTDTSFILPNLYELPEDIRARVMDNIVDVPTMVSLEETSILSQKFQQDLFITLFFL